MSTANNILVVKNLLVKYQTSNILLDVSFAVKRGDYVGIVGPNGAGKTTLIKAILGLVDYEKGRIVFNFNIDRAQAIGYLPQVTSLTDDKFPITAREVVLTALLSVKSKTYREYLVNESLNLVGISNLKNKLFVRLSGGERQKVLLARAIVNKPELLILDEPVNALDPASRDELYKLLDTLNKVSKVSILLVTHDLATIGKYANKILYIDRKIVFYDTFDNFCKSEKMSDYFGQFTQHLICHRHDL